MAFDKPTENKNRLQGTLSQRAALSHKRENSGREPSSGKGRKYWMDNFQPNEMADTIRCLFAEYAVEEVDESTGDLVESVAPFFTFIEHYHGGLKKGAICSAGPHHMNRNKRTPCEGCDIFWVDFAERKRLSEQMGTKVQNPNRIGKSTKYVITILDPGEFFETEQVDFRTGQAKLNREGKPWMEWRKLRYANDPAAVGRKIKRGKVMPWVMNKTQFDLLTNYAENNIGTCCSGCGEWGHAMKPTIQTIQYTCQGCTGVLIDMQTSTLAPNQIKELVKLPIQCSHCGTRNFAHEVVHCPTCVVKGTAAKRASLWEVDINLNLVPAADDPKKRNLVLNGYTAPTAIDPQFADIAKPMDLVSIFKPTPIEEQRALWGLTQQSDAPQTQPYSRP